VRTTKRLSPMQQRLIKIGVFAYGLLILGSTTFYLLAVLTLREEISVQDLADGINQGTVERVYVYRTADETFLTADFDDEENTIIVENELSGTGVNVPYEALTTAGAAPPAIQDVTFTLAGDEPPHPSQDLLRQVRDTLEATALPMSVLALLIVLALIRFRNSQQADAGPPALPHRTDTSQEDT
jgi:hypothetical protein